MSKIDDQIEQTYELLAKERRYYIGAPYEDDTTDRIKALEAHLAHLRTMKSASHEAERMLAAPFLSGELLVKNPRAMSVFKREFMGEFRHEPLRGSPEAKREHMTRSAHMARMSPVYEWTKSIGVNWGRSNTCPRGFMPDLTREELTINTAFGAVKVYSHRDLDPDEIVFIAERDGYQYTEPLRMRGVMRGIEEIGDALMRENMQPLFGAIVHPKTMFETQRDLGASARFTGPSLRDVEGIKSEVMTMQPYDFIIDKAKEPETPFLRELDKIK